jgi:hypothetical protein
MRAVRTLIYKRTHTGDPDASGCFGIYDCMGRVRALDFDAVIGIGSIGSEAQRAGIAGKITWIGIGAHRATSDGRGPQITFEHFVLFDGGGKELSDIAPTLAKRFYLDHRPRYVFDENLSDMEKAEAKRILQMAQGAQASGKASGPMILKKRTLCPRCC